MRLSQKQEFEILAIYEKWLDSYLSGDIDTYDSFFDDDYHFIGSTNNEEFLNRRNTTEFFRKTTDQFAGKTDLRNNIKTVEKFGNIVFLTHLFDAWFINEVDWTYYGRFRFSNALRETKDGWRFIYQHFSVPDAKANEGETIGYEQISEENLKLREAIKRGTVELKVKNRELEIEAALEKVRSQALAMQDTSDLLEIVVNMRAEFIQLGHEAHYFWHMMWLPDKYEKAMTSGDGTKIGFVMTLPRHIHGDIPLIEKWEKSREETLVYPMNVDEAIDYVEKMVSLGNFQQIDPQAPTNDDIKHIGGLTFIMARTTHGEIGYSLPGIVENPPPEDIELLVRFATAFDFAHKRFLDLKKRKEQARETEIQLSLEKVRSRTMAMQQSDELPEAANILFKEVQKLGIPAWSAGYNILSEDKQFSTCIMSSEGELQEPFLLPLTEHESLLPWHDAIIKDLEFFVYGQKGEDLVAHYEYMRSLPELKSTFEQFEQAGLNLPVEQFNHLVRFNQGFLLFITYEEVPEAHDIFNRFGKVFEQTYTRFLDLKKAEAQAKEAQIEVALERVRARTMAMQSSEELADVAIVLFEQLRGLGGELWGTGFGLCQGNADHDEFWFANEKGVFPAVSIPNNEDETHNKMYESWKSGTDLLSIVGSGKELKKHYDYMMSLPEVKPFFQKILDEGLSFPEWQQWNAAYFTHGYLLIITLEPYPEPEILKRFSRVFDQTYTRFLDLQRAEAQARESQIEAALERVRSRTMGMQHSSELQETAALLVDQVKALNINIMGCGFNIWNQDRSEATAWMSGMDRFQPPFQTSSSKDIFLRIYEAMKRGDEVFVEEQEGEELKAHYDYMASIPVFQKILKQLEERGQSPPSYQVMHCAYFTHGYLMFITLEPATEANELFTRFAKVFDQTYTRFLDLQKAEAQAREAEINLALERIRASTMAMHNTEEIGKTVITFFKELRGLGLQKSTRCGIGILSQSEHMQLYTASTKKGQKAKLTTGILDMSIHPLLKGVKNAWENGEPAFSYELKGKDKYEYFDELNQVRNYPVNIDITTLPEIVYHFSFPFKDGVLFVFLDDPLTSEYAEICKRFAKSFSLTYTRFLDLKKAENQAREAQIEVALEKVRSRTMAMQKGEELKDVVVLLYKELLSLGVNNFTTCGYVEINEKTNRQSTWVTNPGGDSLGLFFLPLTGDVHFDKRYEAWKKQQTVFHQKVTGKERKKHLEYAITTFNSKEAEEMVLNQFPDPTVFYCFNFSHGYLHLVSGSYLTKEEESLLARFTRVFEQTYARFLDLKKAEAQAKEAKIETALEKVRSRSMGMHQSEELWEVSELLFDQIKNLGIDTWSCGVSLWYEDDSYFMGYNPGPDGKIGTPMPIPLTEDIFFITIREAKRRGDDFLIFESKGKSLVETYRYMDRLPVVGKVMRNIVETGFDLPKFQVTYCGFFSHGHLMFITLEHKPEAIDIFKRFTKVFEQTYTRFLDLKKAESQAKQAKTEAALERVRSRTMGMQKSKELEDVIKVVFDQLVQLDFDIEHAGFIIDYKLRDDMHIWLTDKNTVPAEVSIPYFDTPHWNSFLNAKKKGENFFTNQYSFEEKNKFYQELFELIPDIAEETKDYYQKCKGLAISTVLMDDVGLYIENFEGKEFSEEENETLLRFGKVFQQTYTRFRDLEKAESQARESQIEAALERIRSRSIGMQKSEDLANLSLELVKQVQELGVATWFCAFNIYEDDNGSLEWGSNGEGVFPKYRTPREGVFLEYYKAGQAGKTLLINEIGEEECPAHYEYLCTLPGVGDQLLKMKEQGIPFPTSQIDHVAFFKYGYLLFITYEPVPESHEIFKRFARVFEQSYTRFLDLQKAEERAREARIETALEKVRSRTLAMEHSREFAETSVVVFEQLLELGISPNRLFIGLIDSNSEIIDAWATNEDGTRLANHFQLKASKNKSIARMLDGWKKGKTSQVIDMEGRELKNYLKYLNEELNIPFQGGLEQKRRIQYLAYFSGGLIGMASAEEQEEEVSELLERFAAVFNLTYIRFKDLKVAEANAIKAKQDLIEIKAARENAEKALSELQQTQKQLIQSEKMASLGELTAGIAHEIQNPLNFVNNFSEVSNELLDEISEEFEKGNLDEVREILNDVRNNLNKINQHGKRADGIVKGMLQHSRKGNSEKEPTDLNALCDEYLRLSYHGLRAKDKSFNANLETDFDPGLGKIDVMAQDIGRVILNLLNNAFYAVLQKRNNTNYPLYEPKVTVSTRKEANQVLIQVRDNGFGIPKEIQEKIFQPFFTTKPTGQGTGLGLSLSYDIVKAHGGDLEVDTKEGEGTTFTIIIKLD